MKELWKWKVLNHRLAHRLCFSKISYVNFYRKVRRLIHEGFVIEKRPDGLNFDVIQLTKKGFDLVKNDLGELKEFRFQPQSLAHDYWASTFQTGIFGFDPGISVSHVSEQEIQSKDSGILPSWVPSARDHIPDGLFEVGSGKSSQRFAIEVELNLKPPIRYDKAAYYFDMHDSKIDIVFWLCGNLAVMKWIFQRQQIIKLHRSDIHHFFITEDFKAQGWNAQARSGKFRGKTIQEICLVNTYEIPGKRLVKSYEISDSEIFFPKAKSPLKKMT